jgi:hypothetical protein
LCGTIGRRGAFWSIGMGEAIYAISERSRMVFAREIDYSDFLFLNGGLFGVINVLPLVIKY